MDKAQSKLKMPQNVAILPISRILFRLLFKINGGIRVSGAENIPKSGGALLCPNHISDADPAAILVAVKRNDLKADLERVRAKAEAFVTATETAIHEAEADQQVIEALRTELSAVEALFEKTPPAPAPAVDPPVDPAPAVDPPA